jgi:plastocyanin
MRTGPRFTVLLCTAGIALAGCRAKDSADANLLRVTTADYAFEVPDQVSAGLTTIRLVNHGPSLHHIQLVRLDQGKTLPDFLPALQKAAEGGAPLPQWATMIGGPNSPTAGDSSTAVFQLDPGTYAMICLIPDASGVPHFAKGMARMITVTGPARAAAEPVPDVTIKLVDYDFQLSTPLTSGHHTIRVENDAQQWHELALVKLNSGKTPMDFVGWVEKMTGPPPGELHGGITGILPGTHAFIVTDLAPGDYALICFFPDAKDGKPHLAHGMIKTITVS